MFRLDPPAEQAVRQRLEPAEADAFLSRLDVLAFDIAEPLAQVYGAAGGLGLRHSNEPRHAHSTAGELGIRGAASIFPLGFLWLTGT